MVAIGIALSSMDDLAMDLLWLWLVALRPAPALPAEPATPRRFAILVPAWDEAAVIGPMLRRLTTTLDHPDWTVFVGTYPNDPATAAAVDDLADPRIVRITGPRPGPTTKADCLNHLWRAAMAAEPRIEAVVLHDSEDVVHPQELRLFDRYLGEAAMVQVPVLPYPDPGSRWVSGHYLDEFAQGHIRDLPVRDRLGAAVPSAGVGTAFTRESLERLAGPGGVPFDAASLTEDYEIGHRLHALGFRGRMVRQHLAGSLVAVREYFPATLETAVRQKSRWLTGIALAGWDRLGWAGRPVDRWMLARDRKGLFTAVLAVMAYALLALVLAQLAARALVGEAAGRALPPILGGEKDALLRFLLGMNATVLAWRLLWRAGFTAAAHGPAEGLRAIPRAVVTNAVNALSALRATDRYRRALDGDGALAWDKTEHRFPAAGGAHGG